MKIHYQYLKSKNISLCDQADFYSAITCKK